VTVADWVPPLGLAAHFRRIFLAIATIDRTPTAKPTRSEAIRRCRRLGGLPCHCGPDQYVWRRLLTVSAEDCWGILTPGGQGVA
jgi:hypothetical protein